MEPASQLCRRHASLVQAPQRRDLVRWPRAGAAVSVAGGTRPAPARLSPVTRSCNLTTTSGSTPRCGGLNFRHMIGDEATKTVTGQALFCFLGYAGLAL